jgi:acetyl-CoA carboxylase biotin carboxyl carrier protein
MAAEAGKEGSRGRSRGSAGSTGSKDSANGRRNVPTNVSPFDLDFVRGLIEAVDDSGIDSLEINRAGTRIRIAKTPIPTVYATQAGAAAVSGPPAAGPALAAAPSNPTEAAASVAPTESAPKSNVVDVKSPMVGTFYRAPAPEAPPYAEVGAHVSKGQTLCILEAMKLMNELECEVDGVLREVLVENADPVEYGQVLFRIEPSGSA